jgi:hypothetical protein
MPCCGGKRAAAARPPRPRAVTFEYVGHATLRAVGPATRRDYWFGHHGARVSVDGRDAPSFEGIPNLIRVGSLAR